MRRLIPFLAAVLLAAAPLPAGEFGSRAMSGWFHVTTPGGWTGRRYMDGNEIFAEEFDANRDSRIDVWRFYRRGILTSEERDLTGDGRVDYVSRWDPNTGNLVAVLRDTNRRGVNDVEVEYTANNRWEARQDRNLDGITDRIVYVDAPQDMFQYLDIDPAAYGDIASAIPRDSWSEMWSDDGYTGAITDYFRFRRGTLTHYGEWNGRRVVWRRVPPDYLPRRVPPPEPQPAAPARPPYPDVPPDVSPYEQPQRGRSAAEEAIRNPFDVGAGYGDYDPYAGMEAMPPPSSFAPEGGSGAGETPQPRIRPSAPAMTELPKNESFARSVPARMRPP
ncbi:MAG: hypothetical protein LBS30_07795, partial [Planctomycetota bacterium]|nr:hypothetical protein [Planctomycetota bacterium]